MDILFAFLLTTIAGLSTGLGSIIAFFAKKTNTKFLSVSLGFSAGVMIYVSLVEIMQETHRALSRDMGVRKGMLVAVIAFFGGMLLIALIDKLIPEDKNPHELASLEDIESAKETEGQELSSPLQNGDLNQKKLMRTGLYTALAIAIHNFPEGLATFVSALQSPTLAIPIVFAIALHNIPEGIAVSVPIYYSTGSKKKAFMYSFLSGLAEPLGGLVGYLILRPFMSDSLFGILFAVVAGIMVFISFDELLPSAKEYGEHHLCIYGLVAGMMVMAFSLIPFM